MTGPDWSGDRVLALCRSILRLAATRLARHRRRDWLAEWEGELWALERRGWGRASLLRFALAGLGEAGWERRKERGTMRGFGQDIRMTVRGLSRSPGFALVAILVVALGVGANTALFGALRAALLSESPYPQPDRLVMVDLLLEARTGVAADTMPWSYPKFELAKGELDMLESLAGYMPQTVTLTGNGGAARVGVEYVTPSYFPMLSVSPILGRVFDEQEEAPAPGAVALLGHGLWRSRFGGDPGVIGGTVAVNGASLEIIGVLPPGFRGLSGSADVWVPVAGLATIQSPRRLQMAWAHWLRGIGRLRGGVTLEQARAQATRVGEVITEAYPDPSGGSRHGVAVVPFLAARVNPIARNAIGAVSVGALLLLLIACANVGALTHARGSARRSEFALRAAMGAGRGRLVREALLESLLLATVGGAIGVLVAWAGQHVIAASIAWALDSAGTRSLQYLDVDALGVDVVVLAAGLIAALLAGLVAGIMPARAASRPDLARDLRAAGGTVRRGHDTQTARSVLVAGQLALTLVLMAGAGLMGASLAALARIDVGFTNHNVLSLRYARLPSAGAGQPVALFEQAFLDRTRALPGVTGVAIAPCAPLSGRCEVVGLRQVDDRPPVEAGSRESVLAYEVSPEYFATLGIRVIEGRTFEAADAADTPPVVVINEAAARKMFGAAGAVGHRLSVTHELTDGRLAEIVGVVADVRHAGLEQEPMPAVYMSRDQSAQPYGTMLIAVRGDPYRLVDAVRGIVTSLDPDLPLYDVTTIADIRARASGRTRVLLGLLTAFALTGLLLSAVGLYGIVSWTVTRRTREMGLRVVLGAAATDVFKLVMTPPVRLALAGAALGLAVSLGLNRMVEGLLFGVRPTDPRILTGAALVLLIVAAIAAWLPARRTLRVDPAHALRSD